MQIFTHMKFEKVYRFVGDSFNFDDVRIFLAKSQGFLAKIIPLLKTIVWELCQRFLVLISVFVRQKATVYGNISFTDHASRFTIPDCSKVDFKWENDIDGRICQYDVTIEFL